MIFNNNSPIRRKKAKCRMVYIKCVKREGLYMLLKYV